MGGGKVLGTKFWGKLMQMVATQDVKVLSLTRGNIVGTRGVVSKSADQRADTLADGQQLLTLWQTVKGRG